MKGKGLKTILQVIGAIIAGLLGIFGAQESLETNHE